jgi:hypothetical protein
VSHSRRTIALVAWMLALAALACQTPQTPPATPTVQVSPSPLSTQTLESEPFPTVTPIATSTLVPTSTQSPTPTTSAPGRVPTVTAKPSGPVARLEFTEDDIRYSLSPKRKEDGKVQLTITLQPRGGLAPYSFTLDNGPQIQGLTYTFGWHNCQQSEPHTIVVISADGQRTKSVGFMFPYDC